MLLKVLHEFLKRILLKSRVGIEEKNDISRRAPDPLVIRGVESPVLRIFDELRAARIDIAQGRSSSVFSLFSGL